MTRRALSTALGAALLAASGFALGAFGSAYRALEARAEPWRKARVAHEGTKGTTTETRVVFENPALPLQAIELTRGPRGLPEVARVARRDGSELTVRFQGGRPKTVEAEGGASARLTYEGSRVKVEFFGPGGRPLGGGLVTVPLQLRAPLSGEGQAPKGELFGALSWVREAHAQAREAEPDVSVTRHVELSLDLAPEGQKEGRAEVDAKCAPFACVPLSPEVPSPGLSTLRVAVTGTVRRAELPKPSGPAATQPFERVATAERKEAARALPALASAVAAVSVTSVACRALGLALPVCVPELGKSKPAGAAVHALGSLDVPAEGRVVAERAEALYYEEQARMKLDRKAEVEVCASQKGYARTCTKVEGRPFAPQPMPPVARRLEPRRGAETLEGSFVMIQGDGADCRFSPSPRTGGPLRFALDERGTVTATLRADERGTRADLSCSLGTANMSFSQVYSATLTQVFSRQELDSGAKLSLRMRGTMSGVGAYSFSNCRTGGGVSANCPAGKSEGYSYPVELVGELDLGERRGSGRLVVSNAPLPTSGTWRVPAENGK